MSICARTLLVLVLGSLPFLLLTGCKDTGCQSDSDCKGARVCNDGQCVDGKPSPQEPAPRPSASTSRGPSAPSTPPASGSGSCTPCATQEDFDAAMRKKSKCCPVTACTADSGCPAGRVCCRIPDGQLCADSTRCATADRVGGSKKAIACGQTTCDRVCCATSGKCAQSPDSCERATNGEGTIYECDGPEDCGTAQICCLFAMDRTTASDCVTSSKCTGTFHHPRYDQDIPERVLCHADSDCVHGGSCSRAGEGPKECR
jgi:hypothetical protein